MIGLDEEVLLFRVVIISLSLKGLENWIVC